MSFDGYKEIIEEDDLAILYLNPNSMYPVKVVQTVVDKLGKTVDNVFQTTYGALKVKDLIGKKFGSKVNLSKGWAYVLHPTPELWTLTLPHRTQIIYTPDISMIIMQLELQPGSVVVESGTGSGSLTHALARSVRPSGHVYTFDFHEQRVAVAREEFSIHRIDKVVTCAHRDVCKDGFGDEVRGKADAVFLDLPHPWLVIDHSIDAIKSSGGRFCSFSPCIEQVQKTCQRLQTAGFTDILTMECLRREYSVQNRSFPLERTDNSDSTAKVQTLPCMVLPASLPGHTGYLTFASLPPLWARVSAPSDTALDTTTPEVELQTT
ncbi:tRNA (adenine(58)-N(1))-methyltransferase catalytic subunit TRMT61A [Macrosteles quadrilineatus]|uniref:tRNA (adenine(58)-N(1))-methyltransferase catalytic subunit TRMT61A n=1 Tax=Macrosteles quadrilineatus TaxID=74068 RepID=UPI0023E307BE|nr:tRNA (adenine(58)-N(1))-methyltransferase catalytic subunit TRMT61A [Macrosteles quadrilineatus]XP_054271848.1 tRNA (adenine(58)-N(1))-methyltransferase catalytic subunit TRMT61A [Macrosteles quadrilineatus]